MNQPNIAREVYDAFQRGEFDRWDAVIHPNVITNRAWFIHG